MRSRESIQRPVDGRLGAGRDGYLRHAHGFSAGASAFVASPERCLVTCGYAR